MSHLGLREPHLRGAVRGLTHRHEHVLHVHLLQVHRHLLNRLSSSLITTCLTFGVCTLPLSPGQQIIFIVNHHQLHVWCMHTLAEELRSTVILVNTCHRHHCYHYHRHHRYHYHLSHRRQGHAHVLRAPAFGPLSLSTHHIIIIIIIIIIITSIYPSTCIIPVSFWT